MFNHEVKIRITDLLTKMMPDLDRMVDNAPSLGKATENIMKYLSSELAGVGRGYISSIYSVLSQETLKEELFQNPINANKYYALDLDKKLIDAYRLDINTLDSYKKGITVKEVNKVYTTALGTVAGAGIIAGSTKLVYVLLGVLFGTIKVPFVVMIGGAFVGGILGGAGTYFGIIPRLNKRRYKAELRAFMRDLEAALYKWVDAVESYYKSEVTKFKESL
jgi:hypothetical protein